MRGSVRSMMLAALLAGLTAVCARLAFNLPFTTVPFTLQVLAVLLAGALLGPRWGAVSQLVYLLLGAVGLPVFAHGTGGLAPLAGPTAGYLWSYPVAALAVGALARPERAPGLVRTAAAMLAGLVIIYLGGAGWAVAVMGLGAGKVFSGWVLPFIPFDLFKVAAGAMVAQGVTRALVHSGVLTPRA